MHELEQSKHTLIKSIDEGLRLSEEDISAGRNFYEKMRNYGIHRFDHLMNLCLCSSLVNADLMLLLERYRISERRMEKLLCARILALTLIEYLKDINDLLGFKLIQELNSNNYKEFVAVVKQLNSDFATVRKKHEKILTVIRNNIAAHKIKDGLKLVQYAYNLDTEEIYNLGHEVLEINSRLTKETASIFHKIIDEAKEREKQNLSSDTLLK